MSETKPDEHHAEARDDADPVAEDEASGEARRADGEARGADGEASGEARGADDEEKTSSEQEEGEGDLLTRGNPPRYKRGLIAVLAGGVPAFLLMAKIGHSGWGIPLGLLFICVFAFGVMDLLGTFDDRPADGGQDVASSTTLGALVPSLGLVFGLTIAFGGALALAQSAVLSPLLASALVPGTFIALVAAVYRLGTRLGPWRTDELGLERPLLSRHGFWVIVVGALLYLPGLGVFSLWDPWETHYGEVAREVLARDDWVSLWWAQDGWFWSKPILNFWIQALAMGSLGTHFQPDQMLIAANGAASAHPEWVVRAPNVLLTIAALYLLYKGVAKVFGRRAGLLGAIVLATMPDWYFLAHQTMADMPFVAPMTAAMGLLLYGLNTDEEARARLYEVEAFGHKLRLSLWHLVFGAVLLCALPQILYLLSRNLDLVVSGDGPKGFRFHWDEFRSGSAGNCGLPGNEACNTHGPATLPKGGSWWYGANAGKLAFVRFFAGFEPACQALVWSAVLGGALYLNWGERRSRRLVYIAAWLFAAIATMAKGPAGFGLPILCAFAYVATKKRWSELLRFELVSGLLVVLAVAIPWYVAMYVRHGSPFTDRLIFHDMFNRAFSHVHDTNEGDDTGIRYYVWQLGYATFPWSGLVPLGLLWGFRRSDSALARVLGAISGRGADSERAAKVEGSGGAAVGDASVLLVMWFLFAFALFTLMGTKFHHYIFPAVPPAAMLVGVVLDDMLGRRSLARGRELALNLAGLALAALVATIGASKLWPGSVFGARPEADARGSWAIAVTAIAVGAAIFAAVASRFRGGARAEAVSRVRQDTEKSPFRGGVSVSSEPPEEARRRAHEQLMLGAAAIAAALATVLVGRDLALKAQGAETSGGIRLLQLFTYNYKRPWPDTLDFSAILGGFTIVAGVLGAVVAARAVRRQAVLALGAFAMLWAAWGLDVYMLALSPHWGQHELIEAYYRDRKDPDEVLVAYQMNWKGENFYTGNRVPAFVSTGATFQTWMKKEREKGTKVMYFITEHSRTSGLRSEVAAKSYKELTDKALCNKFVLVRAEL